jgi:hypothetical protein
MKYEQQNLFNRKYKARVVRILRGIQGAPTKSAKLPHDL